MTEQLDVWIGGRLAGRLARAADGRVEFAYDDGYRLSDSPTPLSLSLPLDRRNHDSTVVAPWLANLLPDNERVLARWAEHFGSSDTTAFGLLRHVGTDCPGAVQIVEPGVVPSEVGAEEPQSDADLERRIAELREDPAAWNPDDEASFGRFSLAGAQGKFALARHDDGWFQPTGRTASTHIFKVGVARIVDSDLAELATTRAARALGLPVPEQDLLLFGRERALVSRRYDRVAGPGSTVVRVHQEDFCQALGVWPVSRYEKEESSGPTMADLASVVDRGTTPGTYRDESRDLFVRAITFNLLSLGTDAHAKNHALLHVGPVTRMAPLYDLGSAAFAWDGDRLLERAPMAVRYGLTRVFGRIGGRELLQTADALGTDRDAFAAIVRETAAQLPDALADAVRRLPVAPVNPHFAEAPGVIAAVCARIVRELDRVNSAEVEPFAAPRHYTTADGELRRR